MTYTFITPATVGTNRSTALRVGLFDSLDRAGLNADLSASSGSPNALYGWSALNGGPGDAGLPGFMFDHDVNTGVTADLSFRDHNTADASGRLLGTTSIGFVGPVGAAGGKTVAQGDTDGDGDVDDSDLGTSFSGYTVPLGPASVPEPTSLALITLGGRLAARHRRK